MAKKGLLGTAIAIIALLSISSTAGAEYGVTPQTVVQGESITVEGIGCPLGSTVSFELVAGDYRAVTGSETPTTDGNFTATITIPSDAPAGPATLTATCGDTVIPFSLTIAARAAAAPITDGALPRTGSDNTQTLLG
ncbi:MAG TPA: hypothetical protein VHK88_01310, partial [Aquihabitans sp.]|nr:hypothetical protein [Aquihabitans sp.]